MGRIKISVIHTLKFGFLKFIEASLNLKNLLIKFLKIKKYTLLIRPVFPVHLTSGGWHKDGDTVFNLEKDSDVFALLDEAWQRRTFSHGLPSGRIGYTINMGRVIGTRGEKKILIITEPTIVNGYYQVASAYPIR
jgi:hypothetical protein